MKKHTWTRAQGPGSGMHSTTNVFSCPDDFFNRKITLTLVDSQAMNNGLLLERRLGTRSLGARCICRGFHGWHLWGAWASRCVAWGAPKPFPLGNAGIHPLPPRHPSPFILLLPLLHSPLGKGGQGARDAGGSSGSCEGDTRDCRLVPGQGRQGKVWMLWGDRRGGAGCSGTAGTGGGTAWGRQQRERWVRGGRGRPSRVPRGGPRAPLPHPSRPRLGCCRQSRLRQCCAVTHAGFFLLLLFLNERSLMGFLLSDA